MQNNLVTDIDDYKEERTCEFKGRKYSARDNGAVLRHAKEKGRSSRFDNIWTFGKKDHNGYLAIAGVRVHLIIAEAFLPKKEDGMVVDHIDTNRCNNRISNLRICTRLENILNNPITVGKIEHALGMPIEKVLKDISVLHNLNIPSNYTWMRRMNQTEANQALAKWQNMIRKPLSDSIEIKDYSKTPKAVQRDWIPRGYFPLCPQEHDASLITYKDNIHQNDCIFYHENHRYIALDSELSIDRSTLAVKAHDANAIKQHILVLITYDKGWFIHTCKRFFDENSLEKYFTIAIGKEWTGGGVFDDYC